MKTIAIEAALLLIAFASAGAATAEGSLTCSTNYRVYPGTRCVVSSGSSAGYGLGRLSNVSNAAIGIECPVAYTGQWTVVPKKIWVVDLHPTAEVTCNVRSYLPTSAGFSGRVVRGSSQGSNAVPQALTLANNVVISRSSYVSMDCSLPQAYGGQRSAIVAYQVGETC